MINKVESFILYLFSFLFFVTLFAQREGDNRIFRKNLGINFNDDQTHSFFEPNSDTLVAKNYYHYGAVPCISDSEGNLQFYEWQPEIEYADSIITYSFLQPEWEKIKEEIDIVGRDSVGRSSWQNIVAATRYRDAHKRRLTKSLTRVVMKVRWLRN